jgi:hypothetical protein
MAPPAELLADVLRPAMPPLPVVAGTLVEPPLPVVALMPVEPSLLSGMVVPMPVPAWPPVLPGLFARFEP